MLGDRTLGDLHTKSSRLGWPNLPRPSIPMVAGESSLSCPYVNGVALALCCRERDVIQGARVEAVRARARLDHTRCPPPLLYGVSLSRRGGRHPSGPPARAPVPRRPQERQHRFPSKTHPDRVKCSDPSLAAPQLPESTASTAASMGGCYPVVRRLAGPRRVRHAVAETHFPTGRPGDPRRRPT
jgi:hypothetical protein